MEIWTYFRRLGCALGSWSTMDFDRQRSRVQRKGIDDDSGDETIDSGRGIEGTVVYGYGDLVQAGST